MRRTLLNGPTCSTRATFTNVFRKPHPVSAPRTISFKRPTNLAVTLHKPMNTAIQRYASTHPGTPYDHIDKKAEKRIGKSEIEPDPEAVSTDSTVRHVFTEEGVEEREKDTDMLAGVKADLVGSEILQSFGLIYTGMLIRIENDQRNIRPH